MAFFRIADGHISQARFSRLPAVCGMEVVDQTPCSLESRSEASVSRSPSRQGVSLDEGDLVTGIVNIADDRAHMVPLIEDEGRSRERKASVRANLHPVDYLA